MYNVNNKYLSVVVAHLPNKRNQNPSSALSTVTNSGKTTVHSASVLCGSHSASSRSKFPWIYCTISLKMWGPGFESRPGGTVESKSDEDQRRTPLHYCSRARRAEWLTISLMEALKLESTGKERKRYFPSKHNGWKMCRHDKNNN